MSFWPRSIDMQEIFLNSIWAFIAWVIGCFIILWITFLSSWIINITGTFSSVSAWLWEAWTIFPLILSLITFIWTSFTVFLTYMLLSMTAPHRYKRSMIIFGQISFFGIMTYIFLTPLYIYLWIIDVRNIMYIFIGHTLLISFWTSLILEIMNNYRHILIGVYWSFVWVMLAAIMSLLIFSTVTNWTAKLLTLIVLLPIINFCVTFFKQLFEFFYYKYHIFTNLDPLWDIFYQIEMEEKEELRLEEEKNLI